LFFDLVFTFAMAQVTQLMLHDLSPSGFGRAALALLAVHLRRVFAVGLGTMAAAAHRYRRGRHAR
jgi:low temperature requirement protein LtrA